MPDVAAALSGVLTIFQLCQGLPDAWAAVDAGGTDAMVSAIETFAMTAPAVSLADVAAQLMVAYGRMESASPTELIALRLAIEAALLSSWSAVLLHAGLPSGGMASRRYIPEYALELEGY